MSDEQVNTNGDGTTDEVSTDAPAVSIRQAPASRRKDGAQKKWDTPDRFKERLFAGFFRTEVGARRVLAKAVDKNINNSWTEEEAALSSKAIEAHFVRRENSRNAASNILTPERFRMLLSGGGYLYKEEALSDVAAMGEFVVVEKCQELREEVLRHFSVPAGSSADITPNAARRPPLTLLQTPPQPIPIRTPVAPQATRKPLIREEILIELVSRKSEVPSGMITPAAFDVLCWQVLGTTSLSEYEGIRYRPISLSTGELFANLADRTKAWLLLAHCPFTPDGDFDYPEAVRLLLATFAGPSRLRLVVMRMDDAEKLISGIPLFAERTEAR